jgi:hypothetical protein
MIDETVSAPVSTDDEPAPQSEKKPTTKKKINKTINKKKATINKKTAKKEEPHSGQSGPRIKGLGPRELNPNELRVYKAIGKSPMTIETIAKKCFKAKGKAKGNLYVRNALRRLICARLLKKVGRGTYTR